MKLEMVFHSTIYKNIALSFFSFYFFFYDHSTLISDLKLISLFFNKNYLQVWLCGGSMEVLPCSRVAHIARIKKPYHSNIAFHTRRNALRVAEVWMDEYKSNVYLAWNIPMEVREVFFKRGCLLVLFNLLFLALP